METIKRGEKLLRDLISLKKSIIEEKEKPFNPEDDKFRKTGGLPTRLEDLEGMLDSTLHELKARSAESLEEIIRDYDSDDAEFDEEAQHRMENERDESADT